MEDEGKKNEKKSVPPSKSTGPASAQPKSGFSFSLKTKNPVPPASKVKPGHEEIEKPEAPSKESLLDPQAKADAAARDSSARSTADERGNRDRDLRDRDHDRERERERERDRERDRDFRERDRRYDNFYDRKPPYRDPRDRDIRDVRDPRESYYRDRERDYRDPRDRDIRDAREIRIPLARERDNRDPRDPRDIRGPERREHVLPRRPDDARIDFHSKPRSNARPERRTPPPEVPKTKVVIRKRVKARPTLTPEYAASDSVYYRKPGNESVVGSGTYGKVFKGVHVYTKDMVALKKIRMEGERDGVSKQRRIGPSHDC